MAWYAVQYKPSQGTRALTHLENQGIPCFYPRITTIRAIKGVRRTKREALFPGYLFIQLSPSDPRWARLRSTRGVLRVVGFCGKPAPLEDALISHLRTRLEENALPDTFTPGQPVVITDGPFQALDAVFANYDGLSRAMVLIAFMQSQHAISVPLSAVGPSP